jgi:hypothetical protein
VLLSSQVASYIEVPEGVGVVFFLSTTMPHHDPCSRQKNLALNGLAMFVRFGLLTQCRLPTMACIPVKTIWPQADQLATMARDFHILIWRWTQKMITAPATTSQL